MSATKKAVMLSMGALNNAYPSLGIGTKQLPTWLSVIEGTGASDAGLAAATMRLVSRGAASGSFMPALCDLVAEILGPIVEVKVLHQDIHGGVDATAFPIDRLRVRVPVSVGAPEYVTDREAERLRNGESVRGCRLLSFEDYDQGGGLPVLEPRTGVPERIGVGAMMFEGPETVGMVFAAVRDGGWELSLDENGGLSAHKTNAPFLGVNGLLSQARLAALIKPVRAELIEHLTKEKSNG
jgi:hypothetical protein